MESYKRLTAEMISLFNSAFFLATWAVRNNWCSCWSLACFSSVLIKTPSKDFGEPSILRDVNDSTKPQKYSENLLLRQSPTFAARHLTIAPTLNDNDDHTPNAKNLNSAHSDYLNDSVSRLLLP